MNGQIESEHFGKILNLANFEINIFYKDSTSEVYSSNLKGFIDIHSSYSNEPSFTTSIVDVQAEINPITEIPTLYVNYDFDYIIGYHGSQYWSTEIWYYDEEAGANDINFAVTYYDEEEVPKVYSSRLLPRYWGTTIKLENFTLHSEDTTNHYYDTKSTLIGEIYIPNPDQI